MVREEKNKGKSEGEKTLARKHILCFAFHDEVSLHLLACKKLVTAENNVSYMSSNMQNRRLIVEASSGFN
ncbi:hypothetical protein D4R86_03170 [bacterium]|nr:MAG: hypothetical protein D4R86_03170 [bacterium]